MNKTLKTKWVKALRSGKYEQGQGKLRSLQDEYCCLGVLASVTGCKWRKDEDRFRYYLKNNFDEGGVRFSAHFLEEIGLNVEDEDTLIDMNDMEGSSFEKIANWIEKNV